MYRCLFLLALLFFFGRASAQRTGPEPESRHGWVLSPHGMLRVYVIFAEIDYDVNPERDPAPSGSAHWPKNQLPQWAGELFDARPSALPSGLVSRYYHDISLGAYTVLGDHLPELVTIKESACPGIRNASSISNCAVAAVDTAGGFRSAQGLSIADFDLWKAGGKAGQPKEAGPDTPHNIDHVMVIVRNSHVLTHGQGSTNAGGSGPLFGYQSGSQSRFGALNGLPFGILKHEFNHLLLGGNNFHSGGGNAATFESHTLCVQGGWSMMGAANSSLLTATGWDRLQLGWQAPGAEYALQALDQHRNSINGDLDPLAGDTGIFLLRDFVTTGDVLRIRLPHIPEKQYQQWLWLENHRTFAQNGSPSDRFHWESTGNSCVDPAIPGLYIQLQIGKEQRTGRDVYGGPADYLRPVLATGYHHLVLSKDTLRNTCPFGGSTYPFIAARPEPLSGNHEQELVVYDRNNDGALQRGEHFSPSIRHQEARGARSSPRFFGSPEHAFTPGTNALLNIGSNPSTNSQLSLTANNQTERFPKGNGPDNRTIYLNGIRIDLLNTESDGALRVRISNDDTRLTQDVIWTADSIVLPALRGQDGHSLTLATRKKLLLDRSLTPTRLSAQGSDNKRTWFAPPTAFTIAEHAVMVVEDRATLDLRNGSTIHVLPNAELRIANKAKLRVGKDCKLVLHPGARLIAKPQLLKGLRKRGVLSEPI